MGLGPIFENRQFAVIRGQTFDVWDRLICEDWHGANPIGAVVFRGVSVIAIEGRNSSLPARS